MHRPDQPSPSLVRHRPQSAPPAYPRPGDPLVVVAARVYADGLDACSSAFLVGAKPLASGGRVNGRRSRSHATRPQGAPLTRRPGAGQSCVEEDGCAVPACATEGADLICPPAWCGPACDGRGLAQGRRPALAPGQRRRRRRLDLVRSNSATDRVRQFRGRKSRSKIGVRSRSDEAEHLDAN
jgi:hypothetical protein